MAQPLVAGVTHPEHRLIGWTPKLSPMQLGLPAGPLAADAAGNVVFEYVRKLQAAQVDPMGIFPGGLPDIFGLPPSYMRHNNIWDGAWGYATIYLLAYYATNGGTDPLPEDQIGELGDFPNWPQTGDTLVQKVFGWSVKTGGWDNYVQHLELRKVLQVQKWNNATWGGIPKWWVYNQWGHDLTFTQDAPGSSGWNAGFDLGVWMNAHGPEIFAAFNAAFTAVSAMTGYGAVLTGLRESMKALATVAAKGDWGQLVKAIGAVGGAMAGLPGVAEFGAAFLKAGGEVALESVALVAPLVQDVVTTVISAEGQVEKIVFKTKQLMDDAQKNADALIQAGRQADLAKLGLDRTVVKLEGDIRYVREQLTPDHLKPWLDKAVAKGRAALASDTYKPGQDVPYYAKGTWDQGIALGTMVNVAGGLYAGTAWENIDFNKLTPQQKRAIFLGDIQVNVSADVSAAEFQRQADLWWFKDPNHPGMDTVQNWADYYKLR